MALLVNDALAQNSQIAEFVYHYIVRSDASYGRYPGPDLLVPVREHENNNRPAYLLLIEAGLSVGGNKLIRTDNPMVDYVRRSRIFETCPDDHRASLIDPASGRPLDAWDLTLDTNLVPA